MLWFLMACNGPTEPGLEDNFGVVPDEGIQGCDNLVDAGCLYPFPSAAYVTETGNLSLPPRGMPQGVQNDYDPAYFEHFVGFGAASPVLFQLPGAVLDTSGVFDSARSLQPDTTTLLIDAQTGERIPHWVETDYLSPDMDPPVFVIRPAIPLPRSTEVVVGVRGLVDANGAAAPTPEGFRQLRDQEASTFMGVMERRATYEDVIFPALEAEGWSRDEVQLAWSFPVRSDEDATRRMLTVRDTIFDAFPAEGPSFTLDSVIDCRVTPDDGECHPDLAVVIDGTIHVPSVVEPPDDAGVRNLRWNDGTVEIQGEEEWHFRLQVPNVAFTSPEPLPVLQYGHGFLGSYREGNNGWLRELAERKGFVILSTSLMGMTEDTINSWLAVLLSNGGRFPELSELTMQGITIQLAQQRMMKTSLLDTDEPTLLRADGRTVWDPDHIYYHGNSQGGSVGTVMMGLSQDVTRGDLGVPGSGYPLLLHRSTVFQTFADAIQVAYPEHDSVLKFLALLGTGWDDVDPLTFAPHINLDPLPDTPQHEVIVHVAKADQQVHNEASFILGRAAGGSLMVPAVRPVFGLPELPYPASPGVGVIEVDFGIPDDPTPLDPEEIRPELEDDGDTHGWLRKWEPAQDQMVHFFETGELIDVCGGQPCFHDGEP